MSWPAVGYGDFAPFPGVFFSRRVQLFQFITSTKMGCKGKNTLKESS